MQSTMSSRASRELGVAPPEAAGRYLFREIHDIPVAARRSEVVPEAPALPLKQPKPPEGLGRLSSSKCELAHIGAG
jgi:hypothetical protein